MDSFILDEREFSKQLNENNRQAFLKMIENYEKSIASSMRSQGYKRVNAKERTVIFSFGEMTYTRSRWKKGDTVRIPVDEKLGLIPRARFSTELIYQMNKLANLLPYRKVAEVLAFLKQIYVSKSSVETALKKAGDLLAKREEYNSLALETEDPEDSDRVVPDILYIEGDGVWVKRLKKNEDTRALELSHFIVHTGRDDSKRRELTNKIELVSADNHLARDRLVDAIYAHFKVTPETIIVSNSDGGKGYLPKTFHQIAKSFSPKAHYHFWDAYHVKQIIQKNLSYLPPELTTSVFKAIKDRQRSALEAILDTAESLIDNENRLENFQRFKRQILRSFQYTKSPEQRGLKPGSIGIMESQHRKITYRMKNRGMYWSVRGADTLSQTIIMDYEGNLRDLFFGDWRKEYLKMEDKPVLSAGSFPDRPKKYELPRLALTGERKLRRGQPMIENRNQ